VLREGFDTTVAVSNDDQFTTFVGKSLTKPQILVYETAVYRLVNDGIAYQKQKISGKRSYYSAVH